MKNLDQSRSAYQKAERRYYRNKLEIYRIKAVTQNNTVPEIDKLINIDLDKWNSMIQAIKNMSIADKVKLK